MKKNKFLLFMLLSVFALILAACGGDDESPHSTGSTDTSTDSEDTATEAPDYGVKFLSI